tara:strand:- start:350 stop:463 length:114 start_codon:yes stop_codon:yes gene_type:complete
MMLEMAPIELKHIDEIFENTVERIIIVVFVARRKYQN